MPINPVSKNDRRRASFASAADGVPEHAGIVVVGGGLAGLEVVTALAETGAHDVLLLEAGPGDDLTHIHLSLPHDRATEAVFAPENDPWFHRPWESDSAHYTGISGLRRRLGGRSLYWHGVVLPLEDWALSTPWWPSDIVADLTKSWRGGPSLYERVTGDLQRWSSLTPGSGEGPALSADRTSCRCRVPAATRPATADGRRTPPRPMAPRRRWSAAACRRARPVRRGSPGRARARRCRARRARA